jgi:hypothetical protein
MGTTSERLIAFIATTGMTKNKFASYIGTSSALVSNLTTQDVDFRTDFLRKILEKYPSFNVTWLLTGFGEMYLAIDIPKPVIKKLNTSVFPEDYFNEHYFQLKSHAERQLILDIYNNYPKEGEIYKDYNTLASFEYMIARLNEFYFNDIELRMHSASSYIPNNKFMYDDYKEAFLESLNEFKDLKHALSQIAKAIENFYTAFRPFDKHNVIDSYFGGDKLYTINHNP